MLAATALDPSRVRELGVTVQVACAGAPLQLSWTIWLNPFTGEMLTA
jgi:hypothetical protein